MKENERLKNDIESFRHVLCHSLRDPIRQAVYEIEDLEEKFDQGELLSIKNLLERQVEAIDLFKDYILLDKSNFEKSKVDVKEVIDSSIDLLKEKYGNVKVVNNCELQKIEAYDSLLEKLFFEILDNAVKFSHNEAEIKIYSLKKGAEFSVFVEDNGEGVEEIYSKLVMNPFQKIDVEKYPECFGMGLAFCSKIASFHEADLSYFENEKQGTTFCINFNL